MPAPLLLDLTHTSHTRARTGIQRVTRSLHAALGTEALGITHDPHARTWRTLEAWEHANLASDIPSKKRGAHWPLHAKLRGRMRRWFGGGNEKEPAAQLAGLEAAGLIVPEIFSPAVARTLPALFRAVRGPRIAVFHDAIALKHPEFTPTKTVARFPTYLIELLAFDGVAAVSEDSRASLVDYWRWLGVRETPVVAAIPLGIELPAAAPSASAPTPVPAPGSDAIPTVLCVNSIEGRKNHLALLEACEKLWAGGARFTLRLIGLAQPQTGAAALARIDQLKAAGRPLRYDGPVTDTEVANAYATCAFTVYPSLIEGFGLPVLESLAYGKPCICSARGPLGESARGGGCLALETLDPTTFATAIRGLIENPAQLATLSAAARARARTIKGWPDYALQLTGWLRTLPRRA